MVDNAQKQEGAKDPAGQPKEPSGQCKDWSDPSPPKDLIDEPEIKKACTCPSSPTATTNCLEDLIEEQAGKVSIADRTKAFKAELEALLTKVRTATQEYSADKYEKLLKQWKEQDRSIAELLRKLDCALPCWRCVIECYICPLLGKLRHAEWRLYGDGTYRSDAGNIHDMRYWYQRDLDAKQRRFQRIKNVLTAWEKPPQTIEKALADNAKLIVDIGGALGQNAAKVVYDVFFRLLPMHLAIAPPASTTTTNIDVKYVTFCEWDTGQEDACCGPDVGELSWRQRLIGPQPHLVHPSDYSEIICCLVNERLAKAKDAVAAADAKFQEFDNEIKRRRAEIDNGLKTFDAVARNAIPSGVDCHCGEVVEKNTPAA